MSDAKGPWSDVATFRTPTLVTLDPPTPLSPEDGSTTTTVRPLLIVRNGAASANAGAVAYEFELDDESAAFPHPSFFRVLRSTVATTTGQFPDALALDTPIWWRVRATNGTVASDWSQTFMFRTPTTRSARRAPDPLPGSQLPLPDEATILFALAVARLGQSDAGHRNGGAVDRWIYPRP